MIGNLIILKELHIKRKDYDYFCYLQEEEQKKHVTNTTFRKATHLDQIRSKRELDIFNHKLKGGEM